LLFRIDIEPLSLDAVTGIRAVLNRLSGRDWPPEITILGHRARGQRFGRTSFGGPPRGKHLLAARDATVLDKHAEAAPVAQRGAQAAAADLDAVRRVEPPRRVGL